MKADLEYVLEAKTFFEMKKRLGECKAELREIDLEKWQKQQNWKPDSIIEYTIKKFIKKEVLGE